MVVVVRKIRQKGWVTRLVAVHTVKWMGMNQSTVLRPAYIRGTLGPPP